MKLHCFFFQFRHYRRLNPRSTRAPRRSLLDLSCQSQCLGADMSKPGRVMDVVDVMDVIVMLKSDFKKIKRFLKEATGTCSMCEGLLGR